MLPSSPWQCGDKGHERLDGQSRSVHCRDVAKVRSLPRYLSLALIACALLLRAIVPAGWMPTLGADGTARISICSGMGPQTVWLDRDGKLHKDAPTGQHHDQQPCGFGALGLGLDVGPSPAVPPQSRSIEATAPFDGQTLAIGRGLAAPPPPSTGPPSLT